MKPICFYHKADLDGVCSGAIVKHFVPDVELCGYDYGEEFPWDKVAFVTRCGYCSGAGCDMCGPDGIHELEPIGEDGEKRTVYMVDVSLPPEDMKRLAEVSNLIWIDHHKSAIETCSGFVRERLLHPNYAACELTWAWFNVKKTGGDSWEQREYNPAEAPEAVRLLGRYDVWDKDCLGWDSTIVPFQMGARVVRNIYDPADRVWGDLIKGDYLPRESLDYTTDNTDAIEPVVLTGFAILRYQAEVNRRACETGAHEFTLHWIEDMWQSPEEVGRYFARYELPEDPEEREAYLAHPSEITLIPKIRAIACNTLVFNSQFFDGFYDPEKHDVMCAYCQLATGKWKVSLYSTKPEIDCGAICKTFGGGGHKQAAGFVCDKLPWEAR